MLFQSTHPVRGGTAKGLASNHGDPISIHPPREGWDLYQLGTYDDDTGISIHPPREGWDPNFSDLGGKDIISIHPPREGWDLLRIRRKAGGKDFNPPTP